MHLSGLDGRVERKPTNEPFGTPFKVNLAIQFALNELINNAGAKTSALSMEMECGVAGW